MVAFVFCDGTSDVMGYIQGYFGDKEVKDALEERIRGGSGLLRSWLGGRRRWCIGCRA
jgi:hypothetical protein